MGISLTSRSHGVILVIIGLLASLIFWSSWGGFGTAMRLLAGRTRQSSKESNFGSAV